MPKSRPGEETAAPSSDSERDQDDDALQNAAATSTAAAAASQLPNPSDRPRPRFGSNFGLSRAVSLGSSVACSILSSGLSSANPGESHGEANNSSDAVIAQQGGALTAGIDSTLDMLRDSVTAQARAARQARRNLLESEGASLRNSYRRTGSQEPFEGSVRFSRTLSVGRLRDRVLRRTPFSDGLFTHSLLYDRAVWPSGNGSARQDSAMMQRTNSDRSSELRSDPSTNSVYNSSSETLREANNRDLLERRSAFLERRRRIRSQVIWSSTIFYLAYNLCVLHNFCYLNRSELSKDWAAGLKIYLVMRDPAFYLVSIELEIATAEQAVDQVILMKKLAQGLAYQELLC